MKRILAAVLAVVLCLGMSGCALFDGFKYMDAMELYEAGSYEEALAIFTELADYADSQAMVELCRKNLDNIQAEAQYSQAESLFAAGDYEAAMEIYTALSMYKDSPIKVVSCQYALAELCMEAEDYRGAFGWFEQLGGYQDSPQKMEEARWLWFWDYLVKNGPVQYLANPEGTNVLSLSALEEGRLLLTYKAEGSLLGIPYSDELKISFGRFGADAAYEAYCVSNAASVVTEEAAGTLYTTSFLPGAPVAIEQFRQTITVEYEDGTEAPEPVVTEDPEQMLLIKGLINTAQLAVQAGLESLIAETGAPVSLQDLGFVVSE